MKQFNARRFASDLNRFIGDRSLREVAKITGVSASMLSRIRNGKTPALNTFYALLQSMNTIIDRYFE